MYHVKIRGTLELTSIQKLSDKYCSNQQVLVYYIVSISFVLSPRRLCTCTNIIKHWLYLFEGMSQDQSTHHSFTVVLYQAVKLFYETLLQHDVTTLYMDRSASWSRQC